VGCPNPEALCGAINDRSALVCGRYRYRESGLHALGIAVLILAALVGFAWVRDGWQAGVLLAAVPVLIAPFWWPAATGFTVCDLGHELLIRGNQATWVTVPYARITGTSTNASGRLLGSLTGRYIAVATAGWFDRQWLRIDLSSPVRGHGVCPFFARGIYVGCPEAHRLEQLLARRLRERVEDEHLEGTSTI
jgi:hypothetical protein